VTTCFAAKNYFATDRYRAIGLLRKASKLFPKLSGWDYKIGFASEPSMASMNCQAEI